MPIVQAGDHELYYEQVGAGDPILLIMGVGATSDYWGETFRAELAARFTVVSYDHRGIGRSGRARADFTVADLADDAARLVQALEFAPAHVVGFSLGGMVAQELAIRHPHCVSRLVLAGTSAGGGERPTLTPETLRRLHDAMVCADPAQAIQAGLDANISERRSAQPEVRAAWVSLVSSARMPLRTVQRQLDAAQSHDATTRLGAIDAPVLVLHGSDDRMIDPAHAGPLAAALGGAPVVHVPGAGHMFFWEAPVPSAELIAGWLLDDSLPTQDDLEVPHVVGR